MDWAEYDRWNRALADVLFPEVEVPVPVYLDLEGEKLEEVASALGIEARHVESALAEVVRETAGPPRHRFRPHAIRYTQWRQKDAMDVPPPILPVLGVFSLAAERMAAGDGMSSQNYFGRLAELIGGQPDELAPGYREVAERLWGGLNAWLVRLGGRRGLPTASSVSFRYVGLSLSQALVRQADRDRLGRFFAEFDLQPRSEVPPAELVPLLRAWIESEPTSATSHLVTIWRKGGLEERVAEIAATALAQWDGALTDAAGEGLRAKVQLGLEVTTFPRRACRVTPYFRVPRPEEPRSVTLRGADGDVEVRLVPAHPGAARLEEPGLVDAENLLEGRLEIVDPVAGTVARNPRRFVVFRRDPMTERWLETRQVTLGDTIMALATDDALKRASQILAQVARPGWQAVKDLPGLPQGWTLIRDVEILSRPRDAIGEAHEFSVLTPITSASLRLEGGLALPGLQRSCWHSAYPPEVRAVSDAGVGVTIRLLDQSDAAIDEPGRRRSSEELGSWSDDGAGAVVVDLRAVDLGDGSYAVEMLEGEALRARVDFMLASASTPDELGWRRAEEIIHGTGNPLSAVCVDEDEEPHGTLVQGVPLDEGGLRPVMATDGPAAAPWWSRREDDEHSPAVRLARPAPGSCFYTGNHYIELPVAMYDSRGRPVESTSRGRCRDCGIEKTYSASYYKNARAYERRRRREVGFFVDVHRAPRVRDTQRGPSGDTWDLALDALRYAGGGDAGLLRRVARQIDSGALFLHLFTSILEGLGHIEVRRSPETLDIVAWEVAPTSVVDCGSRRTLVGYWNDDLVEVLEEGCARYGRRVGRETHPSGPTVLSTDATEDELLEWLEIDGILLSGRAGLTLARSLPALSEVLAALPRIEVPRVIEARWFDPAGAAWQVTSSLDSPGAYAIGRYEKRYFVRAPEDIERGTAAVVDVYLAKHAAAMLLAGRPLLAYRPDVRELVVPLGANLPGLYQRAALLDSGSVPDERDGHRVYRDVAPDVASQISQLLGR